jgi:cell division protease FtsH
LNNNLDEFDFGGSGSGDKGDGNNRGPGSGGSGPGGDNPKKQNIILFLVATLVTLLLVSSFMRMMTGATQQEIPYTEFIQMLEAGQIVSVTVSDDRITITPLNAQPEVQQ